MGGFTSIIGLLLQIVLVGMINRSTDLRLVAEAPHAGGSLCSGVLLRATVSPVSADYRAAPPHRPANL